MMKYLNITLISIGILFTSGLFGAFVGLTQYPSKELARAIENTSEEAGGFWSFVHLNDIVDANFKRVVRPATDFLYSSSALTSAEGPHILSIPPINRYWVFQFMESDTDVFAYVGSRTHGKNVPIEVLIVPKGYSGETYGLEVIELKTDKVWLLGRFQVYGEEDAVQLHEIQKQIQFRKP